MKKLIIFALVLALALGGCSGPAESESASTESGDEESNVPADDRPAYESADTSYPENQYVMDVEHFVNRENDEYIRYLFKVLTSTNWPAITGVINGTYEGFSLGESFSSQMLFNIFFTAAEDYSDVYAQDSGTRYIIPAEDICDVLDKYFVGYELDVHDVTYNFTYLENDKYIDSPGFIGVYPTVGVFYDIYSVEDSGNGAVKVTILQKKVEETYSDFLPTDEYSAKHTFVIEPGENYCIVHSYEIEYL